MSSPKAAAQSYSTVRFRDSIKLAGSEETWASTNADIGKAASITLGQGFVVIEPKAKTHKVVHVPLSNVAFLEVE